MTSNANTYGLSTRIVNHTGLHVVANKRFALAKQLLGERHVVDAKGRNKTEAFTLVRMMAPRSQKAFFDKVAGQHMRLRDTLVQLASRIHESRDALTEALLPWWTRVSANRASFETFFGIKRGDDTALMRLLQVC